MGYLKLGSTDLGACGPDLVDVDVKRENGHQSREAWTALGIRFSVARPLYRLWGESKSFL